MKVLTAKQLSIGEKVTYIDIGKTERGKVKAFCEDSQDFVFVVFNCDNDWDNYFNYTAAKTPITNLKKGWYY